MTIQEFIDSIAGYIKKYAAAYNVCVFSPIIAQAILESNKGTSELAVNAHNYFGLKYRKGRCKTCVGVYHKVGSEQNPDGTYTSSAMEWCQVWKHGGWCYRVFRFYQHFCLFQFEGCD